MTRGTSLAGKVAIITGASSGIGAALAVDLARRGCHLTLTGRDLQRLQQTRATCQAVSGSGGDEVYQLVEADLERDEDVEQVVKQTADYFGRIDILVNNAGIARLNPVEHMSMSEFRQVMRVNLEAPVLLSKLCVPHLEKTKGSIINISSNASQCAFPGSLAYSVSKSGLDHVTRCLALELAGRGVRVNAINPGLVHTNIFKNAGIPDFVVETIVSDRNAVNCLGRCGRLEDLTGVLHFLTSESAAYTTGAVLMVNGGWHNQCYKYDYDTGALADENADLADLKEAKKMAIEMSDSMDIKTN